MAEVLYSDSFIERAQKLLREMVEKNITKIPYGKPFSNFYVVIENPENKSVVAIVEVPDDLKERLGNKDVFVVVD